MTVPESEVRQALIVALQNYFTEESEGGLLTDYVVAMAGVAMTETRSTHYGFVTSDSPIHSIVGMVEMARDHVSDYLYEDEEDDDGE